MNHGLKNINRNTEVDFVKKLILYWKRYKVEETSLTFCMHVMI